MQMYLRIKQFMCDSLQCMMMQCTTQLGYCSLVFHYFHWYYSFFFYWWKEVLIDLLNSMEKRNIYIYITAPHNPESCFLNVWLQLNLKSWDYVNNALYGDSGVLFHLSWPLTSLTAFIDFQIWRCFLKMSPATANLESLFRPRHRLILYTFYECVWTQLFISFFLILKIWLQYHLPNGYCIYIPYVGMEVEMTFLLLGNVVYEKAEGSSMEASDPYGFYFSIKAKADNSNSLYKAAEVNMFQWQETGFTSLFRVIRIRPPLTIMPFGSYLKISYFLPHRSPGLSLQI